MAVPLRFVQRWPGYERLSEAERQALRINLFGLSYALLLLLPTLLWLALSSDLTIMRREWPVLLLFFVLAVVFDRLSFFWFLEERHGQVVTFQFSLGVMIQVAAIFLLGPTAIWLTPATICVDLALQLRNAHTPLQRLHLLTNALLSAVAIGLGLLCGLQLYQLLGGSFPLSELSLLAVSPALLAIGLAFVLVASVFALQRLLLMLLRLEAESLSWLRQLYLMGVLMGLAPAYFSILATVLYVRLGPGAFLFFCGAAFLASMLAHRLSRSIEASQQRTRELAQLERLSRAMIDSPPDASALAQLLREYVPRMLRHRRLAIQLVGQPALLHSPAEAAPVDPLVWVWLSQHPHTHLFGPGEMLPWQQLRSTLHVALVPIIDPRDDQLLGGVYAEVRNPFNISLGILPALQTLASQIAAAIERSRSYQQSLAHERTVQELSLAWQIQSSFLPARLPQLSGWQLSATLKPARQTSGDFYDVLQLSSTQLGLVIADVADKGTGAALYMALSRTLIRTFAFELHPQPEAALRAANARILTDTNISMFVTVFYGILDLRSGRLTYCNAGHNPPYLLAACHSHAPQRLIATGIPLGIEDMSWQARSVQLEPGDMLVLYTDGISEAQNEASEFFEEQRLLEVAQASLGSNASEAQLAILNAVERFVGNATQFDDLTLMVIRREE